jgi:hypothetical protein
MKKTDLARGTTRKKAKSRTGKRRKASRRTPLVLPRDVVQGPKVVDFQTDDRGEKRENGQMKKRKKS